MTDVAPTLLDLAGLAPTTTRAGMPVKAFDGVSAVELLRSSEAISSHTQQYSEITGNRGFYRDGWKLLAHSDSTWQLYDVRADPTELTDLSAQFPGKVAELAAAWEADAWANTVFPILTRADLERRRPEEARLADPVRILAGTPPLERYRSSRLIAYRSFAVTVALDGYRPGDEGVLFAHGDLQGGYLVYIEKDRIVFGYNQYGIYSTLDGGPVPAGTTAIVLRAAVRPGLRWDFSLAVDDRQVGELSDRAQLVGMAPWTGISVGLDARGPVSSELRRRRGVFRYTGMLRSVTYAPGAVGVPSDAIDRIEAAVEAIAD